MNNIKRKIGTVLLVIGILFLIYAPLGNVIALPGYLRFLERGGTSAAGNTMDASVVIGTVKTILWMMAYQIGTIATLLGAILRSGVKRSHMVLLLSSAVLYIGFSSVPVLNGTFPGFFAIGGCLILIFFVLGAFRYENLRKNTSGTKKVSLDLRMAGLLFYSFAAWHVCGLGSVGHILEPEMMLRHNTSDTVRTLLFKIMIEFVLAGLFTYFSFKQETKCVPAGND